MAAEDCYRRGDHSAYLISVKKAVELSPNNPKYMFSLARAYALNGNKKKAIKWLEKTLRLGFYFNSNKSSFDQNGYNDFSLIRDTNEFRAILKKSNQLNMPINNSEVAFKIPERDLIPEGIAYDPVSQVFYIGSIYKRKIISVQNGEIRNFTQEAQDNLWSVIGLKVDAERRILWVNSAVISCMKGFRKDISRFSGVFKYDLKTGELIKKYILNDSSNSHLFNDLALSSKGDVFITDSSSGAIFFISKEKDELEFFMKPEQFRQPKEEGKSFAPYGRKIMDTDSIPQILNAAGFRHIESGITPIKMDLPQVRHFYSIPAQSAGLYPKTPYDERLELLDALLEHIREKGHTSLVQRWGWHVARK